MEMKRFFHSNLWIISVVLFPLSWVTYSGPNLSFLAWFALVPLFAFLNENKKNFKKFYGAALAVTSSWTLATSGWLFHFPIEKWLVALTIFSETVHISAPYCILYFVQKKIGFSKAVLLLPFMWVGWEWLYLPLQHTMGTHLLPYTQGSNLWLIQMADLGGMWLISFWVMLFNAGLFFILQSSDFHYRSKRFAISAFQFATVMIVLPLLYGGFALQTKKTDAGSSLQVSIIPTQFEPEYLNDQENQKAIIEETLHRTDSLAYDLLGANKGSDLYVWPEAGTSYWMQFHNLATILHEATTDWSGALLTGCRGIPVEGDDQNAYVSGVMVTPRYDSTVAELQYHHKTTLVPGAETMPYRDIFKSEKDRANAMSYTAGSSFIPLKLKTKEGDNFNPGISLCYEQWFPSVWTKSANNGTEFFVHMAAEGWYGDVGYAQFMANVSRFRAVETRRSVVRSSNKGLSMFINALGQTNDGIAYGSLNMTTAHVMTSREKTLFSQYPDALPISCIAVFVIGLMMSLFENKNPSSIKSLRTVSSLYAPSI